MHFDAWWNKLFRTLHNEIDTFIIHFWSMILRAKRLRTASTSTLISETLKLLFVPGLLCNTCSAIRHWLERWTFPLFDIIYYVCHKSDGIKRRTPWTIGPNVKVRTGKMYRIVTWSDSKVSNMTVNNWASRKQKIVPQPKRYQTYNEKYQVIFLFCFALFLGNL